MTSMKSIVMQDGGLHLDTIAMPVPGPGQVLVKSRACGNLRMRRRRDPGF